MGAEPLLPTGRKTGETEEVVGAAAPSHHVMHISLRPTMGARSAAVPPRPFLPGYTHVSSHMRARHSSIGIAVPVYRGQK